MSREILNRFGHIIPPVMTFTPFHPETPLYTNAGKKVISLIARYEERFPEAYRLAKTLTPFVYGDPYVPDLKALQDAKWLLHIKPNGAFVCNAVIKSLACGVPVMMDEQTWKTGYFTHYVRNNYNALVVPADELGHHLQSFPENEYDRIKRNCISDASRFKQGMTWNDGWWER